MYLSRCTYLHIVIPGDMCRKVLVSLKYREIQANYMGSVWRLILAGAQNVLWHSK